MSKRSEILLDRESFLSVLVQESGKEAELVREIGGTIISHACAIQRMAVNECNRPLADCEKSRYNRSKQRMAELAKKLGVQIDIDGDPRGSVCKLMTPKTKRYNTWGGEESGWAIPINIL